MRTLKVILFLIFGLKGQCQNLILYTDTTNHFSIGIPSAWEFKAAKTIGPGIKLIVNRPNEKDSEMFVENFNVNVIHFPNSNIEMAYSDLKDNISKRKGYEFISESDTIINGMKYKWHLEKHANVQTSQPMMALIILGYKNDNGYMVTLATSEQSFPRYYTLFKKIAGTFGL